MKSVIVTGASSGIGRNAALVLANAGYRVFGLARNYDRLSEISNELKGAEQFHPLRCDITRQENFGSMVSEIASHGQVFGLVNCAGYVEPGAIEDLSMDGLRLEFETNFFGLVALTKHVIPLMVARREGRIINVSSLAGLISLPLIGAYCASKHALEAVSEAMRIELWNTGIRVVSINPGVIETNIHGVTADKISDIKGSRFANAYRKYLENVPRGLEAITVGQAILDAITSGNPRRRYVIGSMKEKAGVRLRPYVPDSIYYPQISKRLFPS